MAVGEGVPAPPEFPPPDVPPPDVPLPDVPPPDVPPADVPLPEPVGLPLPALGPLPAEGAPEPDDPAFAAGDGGFEAGPEEDEDCEVVPQPSNNIDASSTAANASKLTEMYLRM